MRLAARPRVICAAFALAIVAIAILGPSRAQEPLDIKARYAKQEVMIPMRDGTRLFTIMYSPRDTSQSYPFMLTRTAYSIAPYGPTTVR